MQLFAIEKIKFAINCWGKKICDIFPPAGGGGGCDDNNNNVEMMMMLSHGTLTDQIQQYVPLGHLYYYNT